MAPLAGLIPIGPASFILRHDRKAFTKQLTSQLSSIPSRSTLLSTNLFALNTRPSGSIASPLIPAFLFTAKLWQKFTHEPVATAEDERVVRAGFDVLAKPANSAQSSCNSHSLSIELRKPFSHLAALLTRFADYPLVVELRHASWQTPETLQLLHEYQAGFCNIDQPIIGNSLQPSADSTSPVGYVRFHGRRYDTWFTDDPSIPGHERYNYLYSAEELDPWVARIRKVQQATRTTFVVTNNHFQGKAVVNALQLISVLKGTKVKVPDPLRQHYPQLESIASEMPAAPTLFPLGTPPKNRRNPNALLLKQILKRLPRIHRPSLCRGFYRYLSRLHVGCRRSVFFYRRAKLIKFAVVFRVFRGHSGGNGLRTFKLHSAIEEPALFAAMQFKIALWAFPVRVKSCHQHRSAVRTSRTRHRSYHPRRAWTEMVRRTSRSALRRLPIRLISLLLFILLLGVSIAAVTVLAIHKCLRPSVLTDCNYSMYNSDKSILFAM